MRKYLLLVLVYVTLVSCHNENEIKPSAPFIQAEVDGTWTVFSSFPSTSAGPLNYIATNQEYFAITLLKNEKSTEMWVISVTNVDVDAITLPYTIQGPSLDFTGQLPEVYTSIYDPAGGSYGKWIADANSFNTDLSLTITSVTGGVISGTFEGAGFLEGKFQAKLERIKL